MHVDLKKNTLLKITGFPVFIFDILIAIYFATFTLPDAFTVLIGFFPSGIFFLINIVISISRRKNLDIVDKIFFVACLIYPFIFFLLVMNI